MRKLTTQELALYLGCECQTPEGILKLGAVYENTSPVFYDAVRDFGMEEIKPILRPLTDMTEEEKKELSDVAFGDTILLTGEAEEQTRVWGNPLSIKFLITKHFDLFGWIEKGLAIDRTKLKQ